MKIFKNSQKEQFKRKKSFFIFFLIIIAGLSFYFAHNIFASSTIYVNSLTGNDSTGDGSAGSPYKTFHKGYTMAVSGDTLDLTGTFTWTDADETGDVAGSGYIINKNLTIQGQGTEETIVQAANSPGIANRNIFSTTNIPSATVIIKNLTLQNGVASSSGNAGGAITNNFNLTLEHVNVKNNRGDFGSSMHGAGAIYSNVFITIRYSTIENNNYVGNIYGSGGVYIGQDGTAVIENSTFTNNDAITANPTSFPFSYAHPSGAFGSRRYGSAGRITNSTFFNNSTNSYGGAIQLWFQEWIITNSTIINNTAGLGAGGILWESSGGISKLFLKNTILANNIGGGVENDFHAYDTTSENLVNDNGYNIVEYSTNKTWDGPGNITGNQENLRVDTQLRENDTIYGPYTLALLPGSVAVDAGDPTNAENQGIPIPVLDQRGSERLGITDIGAYELAGFIPEPPTNIQATDGTHTDKVTITWTKSYGATGYIVYRDNIDISGLLGDVATYDDTEADAGTITPGQTQATKGEEVESVNLALE